MFSEQHFNGQPTIASFTTLRVFPSFHLLTKQTQKNQTIINPRLCQKLRFSLENTKTFLLETEKKEPNFAEMPQINFLSKLER